MSINREHERKIKFLEIDVRKLQFENRQLSKRLDAAGEILGRIQPILGRLIAIGVLLEIKGLYDGKEVTEYLVAAASEGLTKEVRSESQDGGMGGDSGDSDSGVSGDKGVGGDATSDPEFKNSKRASIIRLSDVRAAHDSSDRIINIGSVKKENISPE